MKKGFLKKIEFIEKYHLHYALFALSFIFYILTKNIIFAILGGASILLIVGMDVSKGVLKKGAVHELKEIFIAIFIALAIWFGLIFILGTNIPLNAIVSCSMLPDYERGDLIVLKGTNEINTHKIYIENPETINNTAIIELNGEIKQIQGSLFVECMAKTDNYCMDFRTNPENYYELRGPLKFNYGVCRRKYNDGNIQDTICIKNVEYAGKIYEIDKSHDVVVYSPKKEDLFALTGEIIHRAYFEIDSPKGKFYLIKGDNNPIFDIQMYSNTYNRGNSLVHESQIQGISIARVPYVGYAKLFLFGMWAEPEGCESFFIE